LELGCCDGSNIIATGHCLPNAECWGVDLSAQQIADGQAVIEAIGLRNVTLKQLNILEVDEGFGRFDYIIAHGIFSWVSREVQDQILNICQRLLVQNGVAYVSYNTAPGWSMHKTFREMMRYHSRSLTDTGTRASHLKNLLKFLAESAANGETAYSQLLSQEANGLLKLPESFVFQEFLEEECQPEYFYQFVERARGVGLAYLADAFFPTMLVDNFPPLVAEGLRRFEGDLVHQEQLMDWLRNRHFRHTLLCHEGVSLNRSLSVGVLEHFYIASPLQPVAERLEQSMVRFESARGSLSSDRRVVQLVMGYLGGQWPRAVGFVELLEWVQHEIGAELDSSERVVVGETLLRAYSKGLVEFHVHPTPLVIEVSERPQVGGLARWEAQRGRKVTNQRCEWITVTNEVCLRLLPYLDGSRDQAALLELLNDWNQQGWLTVRVSSPEVKLTAGSRRQILEKLLNDALRQIAQAGLLVA
jgi:methyltransferase-like protein/ubiquinone/menaquinone biosynthesis C-methylase UbiE